MAEKTAPSPSKRSGFAPALTHTNERRTNNSTSPAQRGDHRNRPRTYEQPALYDIPLNPRRNGYVLQLILKQHNWRHSSKDKGVSNKTIAERARFCFWLFDFLRRHAKHFKLDPRSFSGRHVEAVTQYWQVEASAGLLSPATIQTYFSFMKTFAGWIGKPKLLKHIGCYFDDAKLYRRMLASGIDKSWRATGVDADAVIREVEAYDVHAAASLKLMHAFQLRFKESVMFRPHSDVISAAQASKPDDGACFYLDTHRGTKGGRERYFPIDNAMRQEAIDYVRIDAVEGHSWRQRMKGASPFRATSEVATGNQVPRREVQTLINSCGWES